MDNTLLNQYFSVETTHVYCLQAWKKLFENTVQKQHMCWFFGFSQYKKNVTCVVSEITDSITCEVIHIIDLDKLLKSNCYSLNQM